MLKYSYQHYLPPLNIPHMIKNHLLNMVNGQPKQPMFKNLSATMKQSSLLKKNIGFKQYKKNLIHSNITKSGKSLLSQKIETLLDVIGYSESKQMLKETLLATRLD